MRSFLMAGLICAMLLSPFACKDKDQAPSSPAPGPAADTATSTATSPCMVYTCTPTVTRTPTLTRTPTHSPTRTWTPNPTLTPPCAVPGVLGPTGDPNTWAGLGNPAYLGMNKWSVTMPVTAVSMSIYLNNVNPSFTCVRMGLYSDNGGAPGGWLGGTAGPDCYDVTAGWNTMALTDRRLLPGDYWLAFNLQPGPTPIATTVWIGQTTTSGYEVYDADPTPGVFPNPWPSVTPTPVSAVFSVRVNYCPE